MFGISLINLTQGAIMSYYSSYSKSFFCDDSQQESKSLSDLFKEREELKSKMDQIKFHLKGLNDYLVSVVYDDAKQNLFNEGKDYGTTSVTKGNCKTKVVLKKRVTWDTDELDRISNEIRDDLASHYIKKTLTIAESRFKEAPPELQDVFRRARTVETSGVIIDREE